MSRLKIVCVNLHSVISEAFRPISAPVLACLLIAGYIAAENVKMTNTQPETHLQDEVLKTEYPNRLKLLGTGDEAR